MASEILAVPEEHLREVIAVIRTGLKASRGISRDTRMHLKEWCLDEEEYMDRLETPDAEGA